MDLKTISQEELLEKIELFQDRIETVNERLEDERDSFIRNTLFLKLNEYQTSLKILNFEIQRREKENIIIENLHSDSNDSNEIIDTFPDTTINFETKHFQRIVSGIINQDLDLKVVLKVLLSDNRNKASLSLPMGYKSGVLYKRNLNVFYYQGDGEEYDFQLFFENENIIKIIIHQTKTGADFLYT